MEKTPSLREFRFYVALASDTSLIQSLGQVEFETSQR